MKKVIIWLIKGYQKTLSPDQGLFSARGKKACCYFPSCSEYMILAVNKYGVLKGILKGIWRILRCNPFSKGGFDPVK